MEEPPSDEMLRVYALDSAINSSNKSTCQDGIIKKAEKYYGFITRNNCKIYTIKKKDKNV